MNLQERSDIAMSYSPTLGRFLECDPIGYDDGMNPYEFVGSSPIARSDPSGLKWTVTRDGQTRAVANGECGDTMEDLAKLTNMEPERYRKWALPLDGEPSEKSAKTALSKPRKFSIPNKVFVAVGDMSSWTGLPNLLTGGTPQAIKDILMKKGFSVEYRDWRWDHNWGATTVVSTGNDLYGFVYFGHGAYTSKMGKFWGVSNRILIVDPPGPNNSEQIPSNAFYEGQLGLLIMKSCGAKQGGWGRAASSTAKGSGAVWLGDGLEAAGFDSGTKAAAENAK